MQCKHFVSSGSKNLEPLARLLKLSHSRCPRWPSDMPQASSRRNSPIRHVRRSRAACSRTTSCKAVEKRAVTACFTAVSLVMTRDVVVCRPNDWLHEVWSRMKERKLKNVPITYQDSQPPGVLNVRDALQTLLEKVENEKSLLRDYMMGVGFYW